MKYFIQIITGLLELKVTCGEVILSTPLPVQAELSCSVELVAQNYVKMVFA